MKNRLFTVMLLLVLLVSLTGNVQATSQISPDARALVYVKLGSADDLTRFASTQLPMYTMIDGGLLSGADRSGQQRLVEAGLSFKVVDSDMRAGTYYLAETHSSLPAPDFSVYGQVLLNLGSTVLLRMDPIQVDALAQAGAELRLITLTPKPLPMAQSKDIFPDVVDPDPLIQGMINQVTETQVYTYDRQLAGELPVWVDGDWYTIPSRYTYSGTPIQKATSYVGQQMQALGLDVEYHTWGGASYPNVIGEIPGLVNPEDIFIIGAHIDDVQGTPGADDNASGSVATLIAADILSQYQWGCTMRFAFWTGEEQGLNGSAAYAQRSHNIGENILGYLNLDMIAWNTLNSPAGIDVYHEPLLPPTLQLAQLFVDVVDAYNINLIPQIATGVYGSDHASFWDYGYTAILGIEDNGDFNPYYHGPGDTPAHTDPVFFTDFVKASIGTYAHMSDCLIPSGLGALKGHVTAASGGVPIEGATVIAEADPDHPYKAITDVSGYYTRTLLADTYTVTASAYSYLPASVSGVVVTTDTVTTQDFILESAPIYIISGTVTESGTGLPLLAEINFIGSPITVWSDPATGFYQAELPQGSYTMQVKADLHNPQERDIFVDHDQTQNFTLEPLPCVLLVDDDNDAPDTTPYYTAALDTLGYDYNITDTVGGNGPSIGDLQGYRMVLWYSGDTYGGTAGPNTADEINLTAYLEGGGKLFLDSQDYLYDFGLTPFGQNYLGIASFSSDSGDATSKIGVAGDPIGNGLGPFPLTYPTGFTDYGDIVNAGAGASVAFRAGNNSRNLDVDKNGGYWQTIFFGTSWVPLYYNNTSNGLTVLQRMVDFFGGCEPPIEGLTAVNDSPTQLGVTTTLTATVTSGTNVQYEWAFGDGMAGSGAVVTHTYSSVGSYTATVTATNSTSTASATTMVTITDIPIEGLTAENNSPTLLGSTTAFTATIMAGSNVTYTWDFGDGITMTGKLVDHIYASTGTFTATVTAKNSLEPVSVETVAIVYTNEPPRYYSYLMILYK